MEQIFCIVGSADRFIENYIILSTRLDPCDWISYKEDNKIKISQSKQFQEHFYDISTKIDRNLAILNAYEDGYTQVSIATYLNLSTSLVSKVVKSGYSITGV